jgi:hypothetical protein
MLGAYGAVYAALFSPVLLEGQLLAPRDGLSFYYPHFRLGREFWNADLGAGMSAIADPQLMLWYPPAALFSLWPGSWNLLVIAAYVFASWFTCLYVRDLTGRTLAGFAAGLMFGMSGAMISHLPHVTVIHGAMWLPSLALLVRRLYERVTPARVALTALAGFCAVTSGHLQIAVYVLAAAALYALVLARRAARRGRFLAAAVTALALGVALSAVQLIPTMELIAEGGRGHLTFEEFATYSVQPHQLIGLVFPHVLGALGGPYPSPYFGPGEVAETTSFTGSAALLLASIALLAAWWLDRVSSRPGLRQTVWFWGAVAAGALLLALGGHTPLGRVVHAMPVLGLFRAQGRLLLLVNFGVAVLAGIGVDTVLKGSLTKRRLRWVTLAGPGAVLAGGLAIAAAGDTLAIHALAAGVTSPSFLPWSNAAVLIPLGAAVAFACSLALIVARPTSTVAAATLLAALAFELGSFAWFFEWRYTSPPRIEAEFPAELEPIRRALLHGHTRWLPVGGVFSPRDLLPPERSALWGVPSASRFSTIMPQRFAELLHLQDDGGVEGEWGRFDDRSLDLASVRFIGVPAPEQYRKRGVFEAYEWNIRDERRWRAVRMVPGGRIYENLRVLPRVRLVPRALVLESDEVLRAIRTSRLPDGTLFEPREMALVEEAVEMMAGPTAAANGAARIVEATSEHLTVETESTAEALLVVSDSYYPGWTAEVGGRPARVLRANYAQRGVKVPAGRHSVIFEYRPQSLRVGFGISALSFAALVFVVIRTRSA